MSDWKFTRRNGLCFKCTRAFAELEQHYSELRVHDGVLVREDRCNGCFGGQLDELGLAFWRTRHRPGGGLKLDLESLEALFLTLVGRGEEKLGELRYLLSLLLLRKRRLKLKRIAPASGATRERLIVNRPRRPQEYEVEVYDLSAERQNELREELRRIFEGAELEQLLEGAAHVVVPPNAAAESVSDA
jgi:hypothetical protein